MAQEKISVYSLADLKNTSDDAIPNYLNSIGFVQSHRLTDVRLALGYGAFAVAAVCFVWDYKLGFEDTKYWTASAVTVYVLLNTALAAWAWLVEGSIVYVGTSPGGKEKISIASSVDKVDKFSPTYNLTINVTSVDLASTPSSGYSTISLKRTFSEWFDSAGHFVAPPFQTILASSVPIIGKADPKRRQPTQITPAAPAVGEPSQPYNAALLDMLAASTAAESSTTGAAASSKKASKRRKA